MWAKTPFVPPYLTERGPAWSGRLPGGQEIAGSNPAAPIMEDD